MMKLVIKVTVIGVGSVGIPCAALLADVPDFYVTGIQRRSKRLGWKIGTENPTDEAKLAVVENLYIASTEY